MAIQHGPDGPRAIPRPQPMVVRPAIAKPAPQMVCLALGPAMRTARNMVTKRLTFIHLQAHNAPVTIAGDTRRGWEDYYTKYGQEIMRAATSAEVVAWLMERDPDVALGEWDVTVCPRADNLTTLIGD